MKLHRTSQKHFELAGLEKNRSALNGTTQRMFFLSILSIISLIVYAFHVANTARQYMESIFITATGILIFISNISTILKAAKIFDIIDGTERLVNESECLLSVIEYIPFGYH